MFVCIVGRLLFVAYLGGWYCLMFLMFFVYLVDMEIEWRVLVYCLCLGLEKLILWYN